MKFCKDCKFIQMLKSGDYEFARCMHPSSIRDLFHEEYLVDGIEREPERNYCTTSRHSGNTKQCGKDAQFFEEAVKMANMWP